MPKIFISYRRDDSAASAGWLAQILTRRFAQSEIFLDIDNVQPGDDFAQVINTQIEGCDAVIVLIGAKWLATTNAAGQRRIDDPDDFVREEIAAALKRGIPVIPVLLDDARMPRSDELPSPIAALSRRQAVQLRHAHFNRDVGAIIERLERLSYPSRSPGGDTDDHHKLTRTPEGTGHKRWKKKWITSALVVLLAIGALVVWYSLLRSGSSSREANLQNVTKEGTAAANADPRNEVGDRATVREPSGPNRFGPLDARALLSRSAEELGLRKRHRPVQPGTSVGTVHPEQTGTICCIIRSSDGNRYVVTDVFPGSVVIQPGTVDKGRESDRIGDVINRFRWESETRYGAFAGIVQLLPEIAASAEMPSGLGRMTRHAMDIRPGQTVRMIGRTSGLVTGKVTAVNVTFPISGYSRTPVSVHGLVQTTPMSGPGDAGAPVLTTDNELVGMVIAGSKASTVVIPLHRFFTQWDVELIR